MSSRLTRHRHGAIVAIVLVALLTIAGGWVASVNARSPVSSPVSRHHPTAPPWCIGLAVGSGLPNDSPRQIESVLKQAAALGCWLRIDFQWRFIQPSQSAPYYWIPNDVVLAAAAQFNRTQPSSHRVRIVAIVDYAPGWANKAVGAACQGPDLCGPDLAHASDYGQIAAAVARHITAFGLDYQIELGNEENYQPYFYPRPDPKIYALMLRAAYVAVKQVSPRTQVILGGMAPAGEAGQKLILPSDFLTGVYRFGGGHSFDQVGLHIGLNGWSELTSLHRLMAAHGEGKVAIDITELDLPLHASPSAIGYVESLFAELGRLPYIGMVLWFAPPGGSFEPPLPGSNSPIVT